MEITGPLNAVQTNDSPDNWDIQKEMDAINKLTPGWIQLIDAILKPDNAKLRKRITTLEKRLKRLRQYLKHMAQTGAGPTNPAYKDVLDRLTEITRKIK